MHTARDNEPARVPPPFFPPDTTKPTPRPVPALPAAPSRRGMLAAAASALVAGAAIATTAAHGAPSPLATSDDPVVALCRRVQALEAELAPVERRHQELRDEMVTRWGNPPGNPSTEQLWGHDPRYRELHELGDEFGQIRQSHNRSDG